MSVIKKMEIQNNGDYLITTEQGNNFLTSRVIGSRKYEMKTVHTNESLGVVETLQDVMDSIRYFESAIKDYIRHNIAN